MNKNFSPEELQILFKKLPEQLQNAITSPDDSKLEKVFAELGVNKEEKEVINETLFSLLMKMSSIPEFSQTIQDKLHWDETRTQKITDRLTTEAFGDIKGLLLQSATNTAPDNREDILKEIENPSSTQTNLPTQQSTNLIENKLSGLTRMPKEDITVTNRQASATPAAQTPQPAVVPPTPQPEKKPGYQGFDPYREPPK